MWIVRLALRRPYTFVVASILIVILGVFSITRTPVDIFPNIDIPVVAINWGYTGLSPQDMSDRIIYGFERSITTTVNDIEHIESQSLTGIAIVKVFFQPGADVTAAMAEITAVAQIGSADRSARDYAPLSVFLQCFNGADSCRWRFPARG